MFIVIAYGLDIVSAHSYILDTLMEIYIVI